MKLRVKQCKNGWYQVEEWLWPFWSTVKERVPNTTTYFYAEDLSVRRFKTEAAAQVYLENWE